MKPEISGQHLSQDDFHITNLTLDSHTTLSDHNQYHSNSLSMAHNVHQILDRALTLNLDSPLMNFQTYWLKLHRAIVSLAADETSDILILRRSCMLWTNVTKLKRCERNASIKDWLNLNDRNIKFLNLGNVLSTDLSTHSKRCLNITNLVWIILLPQIWTTKLN